MLAGKIQKKNKQNWRQIRGIWEKGKRVVREKRNQDWVWHE
jgi:hypothetical protein